MRARDVMTTTLHTVERTTPIGDVIRALLDHQISDVPVVEHGRLVGIVGRRDVPRATANRLGAADATTPARALSDAEIVRRLLDSLRREPWAEVGHIRPTSEGGAVTLHGEVEGAAEREAIEIAARATPGVRAVRNELVIRPGIADE